MKGLSIGTWHLQDLILSEAAKNGVRLILPLVNFWRELGGAQSTAYLGCLVSY